MKEIGKVESIFRYPIKSIGGERLFNSKIDKNGVEGDRIYAFKDCETGFIVSCKHPRKWKEIIQLSATLNQDNSVIVRDLKNEELSSKDEIESKIYELTSRTVELISVRDNLGRQIREADRSNIEKLGTKINQEPLSIASKENHFFDFAPLHIITTASLNHIGTFYKEGDFKAERFRPNLIIKTSETNNFLENEWIGKEVKIGNGLEVKIIEPTPRCVLITLKQGKLEEDIEILKTIVQKGSAKSYTYFPGKMLKGTLGVYGIIIKEGTVKIGDSIQLLKK